MIETKYPHLWNGGKFILKLPFASGGVVRDKSSVKYGVGLKGVLKCIGEFARNHPYLIGYIHYIIVQPRFANPTEAKVSLILVHIS